MFESCKDEILLGTFFDEIEGKAIVIVHIDTAERGLEGYDVNEPQRFKGVDYARYSELLRGNVKGRIEAMIAEPYRSRIAYAIAVEETDAWLIPLFESRKQDSASHVNAKESLSKLIGGDKKLQKAYVDTTHKALDYVKLGNELAKDLKRCRTRNKSLDLFCVDIESRINTNSEGQDG